MKTYISIFRRVLCALSIVICIFTSRSLVFAEDIYIAQTATGGNTGLNCSNAHSITWLNTSGNWGTGAGNVSAGDTVHLCGTFTSPLTVQGSGNSGTPITIRFEDGVKFSKTTWTGAVINISSKSHIIVDGGNNGTIEATDNGTDKTYKNSFSGVGITSSNNIEIKNLIIKDIFIHKKNATDGIGSANRKGYGIIVDGSATTTSSNIRLHDNTITWCYMAVYWASGGFRGSGAYIYNNDIRYCNATAFAMGSGTYTGVYFYNNSFGDPGVWDDLINNEYHHEAFHYWGSGLTGLYIYGNYLYGDWGSKYTAGIFLEDSASAPIVIYNNVMVMPYVRKIYTKLSAPHIIANNTFVNSGYSYDCTSNPSVTWKNNIEYNTSGRNCSVTASNELFGANPVFVDPASGNYRLQASSPAINAGSSTGLTSYFTIDADGNTRTGTWSIGAFEYNASQTPSSPGGGQFIESPVGVRIAAPPQQ